MESDIGEAKKETSGEAAVVDWTRALKRVGGSRGVLREVVQVFRDEECPALMQSIQDAFSAKDATALSRAGHTLKNNADLFGAQVAFEAARSLEEVASRSDFQEAARLWKILEQELASMRHEMAHLDR